jgi:hypothetical protein
MNGQDDVAKNKLNEGQGLGLLQSSVRITGTIGPIEGSTSRGLFKKLINNLTAYPQYLADIVAKKNTLLDWALSCY